MCAALPLYLWDREVVSIDSRQSSFIRAWDRKCEQPHTGEVLVNRAHDIITFEKLCRKMEQSNLGTVYLAICA